MTRFDYRGLFTVAAAAAIALTSSFAVLTTAYVPAATHIVA